MSLRKCRECGLEAHTDAELELFVKIKRLPHGRDNMCKECFNRKYRLGGNLHEAHLRASRKYDRSPKGREWHRQFRERNRKSIRIRHRAEQKRYAERNPEKIRAQMAARRIPLGSACEICGSTENLQHHHPDYSKPLEIVTLCTLCHAGVHYS